MPRTSSMPDKRGGAREGAGPKATAPDKEKRKAIGLRFSPLEWEQFQAGGGIKKLRRMIEEGDWK